VQLQSRQLNHFKYDHIIESSGGGLDRVWRFESFVHTEGGTRQLQLQSRHLIPF
jgi:hypothetical protein